jgi:hypothetical protein
MVLDETNLMGNRHLRDVLRAKGYDVIYREVGGGHEWVHWRAMLADGLTALTEEILDTQEAWKASMLEKGWAPGEPFRTLET